MNTIRFFLFSFILFSILLVSYILEHRDTRQVLPASVVSIDEEFSRLLPSPSEIVSASETAVFFVSEESVSELMSYYVAEFKQSKTTSADDGTSGQVIVPVDSYSGEYYLIKLDQNKSRNGTNGSILLQSS